MEIFLLAAIAAVVSAIWAYSQGKIGWMFGFVLLAFALINVLLRLWFYMPPSNADLLHDLSNCDTQDCDQAE